MNVGEAALLSSSGAPRLKNPESSNAGLAVGAEYLRGM
ncbi:hypothetical protein FM113_16400 [Leucobacter sp. 7(1)]|nr:hypothetical protein FM113_16400 [Leucobacter sp. 7(1)]